MSEAHLTRHAPSPAENTRMISRMVCDPPGASCPSQLSGMTSVSAPFSSRRVSNAAASASPMGIASMRAEKLTVHFPNQDQQEQEFYQAHGFTVDPSDDVVYER